MPAKTLEIGEKYEDGKGLAMAYSDMSISSGSQGKF